jgi:hypothetical protein
MIAAQIAHTLGNGEESVTSRVGRNPFLHDDVPRSDRRGSAHLSLGRPCNDHPWYNHRDAPGDHRGGSYQSRAAKGNKNMFSVVSIKNSHQTSPHERRGAFRCQHPRTLRARRYGGSTHCPGTFPTHSLHSRASPRARLQRPISHAGSPR